MPDLDLFHAFRWMLATFVTVYATVITLQFLWGWYVYLNTPDRYLSMARRYILVQGLRIRMFKFGPDVAVITLQCVAFGLMMWLHALIF
ncbi:MAG: hypothetical protein ACFCVE_12990 [Phycisphaerae bacterium]